MLLLSTEGAARLPLWCCHFYRNDLRSLKAPEKKKESVQKLDGPEKLDAPLVERQLQPEKMADRKDASNNLDGAAPLEVFSKGVFIQVPFDANALQHISALYIKPQGYI